MATLFMSGLGKLFGVTVCIPGVLLQTRLASKHAAAILQKKKEDSVVMDQSWSRLFAFSVMRTAANAALRWTKQWLRISIGRIGRMFYGTSRSWTSGFIRYAGSHLIAEAIFYPFANEGAAFTFFRTLPHCRLSHGMHINNSKF